MRIWLSEYKTIYPKSSKGDYIQNLSMSVIEMLRQRFTLQGGLASQQYSHCLSLRR
jgi:hypothetical protein